uniref:Uncharacterized protein n=1 Tax=Termitomyces sp. TaxID=1916073 RepID=A0A386TYV2_9AGAR|nr:hypothetical protein C0990_000030 [Termitomyces sp.]
MIVTFVFVLYNIYISSHRSCYIYKSINSDELEVQNSPLDRYATRIARIVMCAKGACDYAPHIGGALGLMLGVDPNLKDSNRDAFFGPLLGSGINKVLPPAFGLRPSAFGLRPSAFGLRRVILKLGLRWNTKIYLLSRIKIKILIL